MQIESDFPGANIIVERIEGDTVFLRQDWNSSSEWWFYWSFRVSGAAGKTVRFQFTDGDVFTSRGPCVCSDLHKWQWLSREVVHENGFQYTFAPEEVECYFALCPVYTEAHLNEFLAMRPAIERNVLCRSEGGREVELLGLESTKGTFCVVLTARMHACETLSNFVLEGIADFWLNDAENGFFLRENVDLHIIPFFDKDGVEQGEQGKNRAPHDHNRDFILQPHYASTSALMEQVFLWRGRHALFLDFHCPWIRSGRNEEIFLLGVPEADEAERRRFSALLQTSQRGPLVYDAIHTIAVGEEWYQADAPTSARWARDCWEPALSTSLEMPYAVAGGQTVTPENSRAFGGDLGRALSLFIQEL